MRRIEAVVWPQMSTLRRILNLKIVAVIAALVALSGVLLGGGRAANADPPFLIGASTLINHYDTELEELQHLESLVGGQFTMARVFKQWDDPFPNAYEQWLMSTNHRLMISLKSEFENGVKVPWADVAAAVPGSPVYDNLVRFATAMRDSGAPIWFIYHHEPEVKGHEVFGEAPQFIAAWRNVVTIFRAQGASNVKFLFTMTDHAYRVNVTDARSVENWYPGDEWVDGIGADTYNWYNCRNANGDWTSLDLLLGGHRKFGLKHPDKSLWIPELGSVEDPAKATRKAEWIANARAMFKQPEWSQYGGAIYFNSEHDNRFPTCDWWIDSSDETLLAISEWVHDPYYGGDGLAPPPPSRRIIESIDAGGNGYRLAVRDGAATDPLREPSPS